MKKRLFCLLLAACMALTLAACGDKAPAPASLSQEESTFGGLPESAESSLDAPQTTQAVTTPGTFSMPYNSSYGWDPYACTSMENRAVMQLIYQGLFTMTPDFEAEPVLVESYTVSEDGLTYTLKLHNAWFSSGDAVDAEDVVYSMAQAASSALYSARFRDILSYEGSGADTVIIHMDNANDRLPCLLDFPIIPNLSGSGTPVGSGPFVRNESALVKDPNWWQSAETLTFDRVELYSSVSAEDTRDNFEIDQVHFVYNDPMASSAATFHCDYELWNSRNTVMQYIGFNLTNGICQDQRIRSAIIRAMDRAEIAESVYHNFADPTSLPVAPTSKLYDEELAKDYNFNADEALSQLLDSGSFFLPENHPIRRDGPGAEAEIPEEDSLAEDMLMDAPEEEPEEAPEDDPEAAPEEDGESPEQTAPEEENPETEGDGYNQITLLVLAGNVNRTSAARMAAKCLEDVGFTVTTKLLDEEEFVYTINTGEYDLYYADVCLTPDFDIRALLWGDLNYSLIPESQELRELYTSALENSGNRYDLYQYIMDKAYLCPILFQNNAVFTTRGVFTGLNPAPGNLFYQIQNIVVK